MHIQDYHNRRIENHRLLSLMGILRGHSFVELQLINRSSENVPFRKIHYFIYNMIVRLKPGAHT